MFSMRKEEFITAFDKWCDKWKEFLYERTLLTSGKTTYTHRRLRMARRSIKTHLIWLYTYEEHSDIQIPNPSLTPIIVESCYYHTFLVLAMDSVSYKFLFF